MFNANSTFYKFFTVLQAKLDAEFDLKALSANACFLHTEGLPVCIVYYVCQPGKRIAITQDVRCVHIDEDLWVKRPDLLMNRIASLSGRANRIHARETVVARIDKAVSMAFQRDHHLQVALPGKYRYGLFHGGELVAIAVFSGGRRMDDRPDDYRSFELLRFCHKQGIHVVGGFSKLLDAFEQEFHPGDVMTYADKDWSDGSSYRKTGFVIVGETEPQCFWVNKLTMDRFYESMLPPEIREKSYEQRKLSGYVPLYNSGSIKLVKASTHGHEPH
jgi:hypothetical protein